MQIDWEQIKTPFLTGFSIGGVVIYYLKGLIDNHFKKTVQTRSDKRDLAKEIIAICTEAESSNYQKPARNREHVIGLANNSLAYDSYLEDLIRKYDTVWFITANVFNRTPRPLGQIEFYRELEKEASHLSKDIKQIVNKWLR